MSQQILSESGSYEAVEYTGDNLADVVKLIGGISLKAGEPYIGVRRLEPGMFVVREPKPNCGYWLLSGQDFADFVGRWSQK